MIIKRKRINKIGKYLPNDWGKALKIILQDPSRFMDKCFEIGLSRELCEGEQVVPKVINFATRVNAEGYFIVHKDLPMETRYRQHYWTRHEWAGRGETREVTEYVDVPYQCYPRTFIPPYLTELIVENNGNVKALSTDEMLFSIENEDRIKRSINLFLSVFGECEILVEPYNQQTTIPTMSLNWEILPPGDYPWQKIKELLDDKLKDKPVTHKKLMEDNIRSIFEYNPDFKAFGSAGFLGYVVFGFAQKDTYVLESSIPDNATYVFGSNWEDLTKQTKSLIINQQLGKARIIHNEKWKKNIVEILEER